GVCPGTRRRRRGTPRPDVHNRPRGPAPTRPGPPDREAVPDVPAGGTPYRGTLRHRRLARAVRAV
ncbi:hypothetical protein NGM37_17035, partial [Streptomyces sp. TRM76130]|nr:hypothetical protein [Streptomyces sp. TRM76130]